ncbi:MAG: IPT/TIG domain-containing protein [Actinobacteria bacterium]|nr:IPT/TIG domain-containing protein [Actinomycetota bacterium]MCL6105050.1 IPT/TIG domain-containing protein [Actinomycetota bacterium]
MLAARRRTVGSRWALAPLAVLALLSLGSVALGAAPASAASSGTSWSAPTTIDTTISPSNSLNSVSCPSATFCVAVDGNGNALTYNGTSWSSPTNIDGTNQLHSVSCVSASFCMAVGGGNVLTYNGTSWSAPTNIDGTNWLYSVSCVSTSFCMAVDSNGNALTYNGTSWTSSQIGTNSIGSVSCVSTSFCAAVGGVNALTYNGTSWSTPNYIDVPGFSSVSCVSTSFCVAVDGRGNALTYNGTSWSAPASIDGTNSLSSVSCVSASFCAAVDWGGNALTYGSGSFVPAITSITPPTGPIVGGTLVTINGLAFTGVTSVNFGGKPAKSFTVNSSTMITAITPATSSVGPVAVSLGSNSTTAVSTTPDTIFTYIPNLNYNWYTNQACQSTGWSYGILYCGGGSVIHSPRTVLILWGTQWCGTNPIGIDASGQLTTCTPDTTPDTSLVPQTVIQVQHMLSLLPRSPWANILADYYDAGGFVSNNIEFFGTVVYANDTYPGPQGTATLAAVAAAANKDLGDNNIGGTVDIVLYSPNVSNTNTSLQNSCGDHITQISGEPVIAPIPTSMCSAAFVESGKPDPFAKIGLPNFATLAVSHEVAEVITDPGLGGNGWIINYPGESGGGEIADYCETNMTTYDTYLDGVDVAQLYDPVTKRCSASNFFSTPPAPGVSVTTHNGSEVLLVTLASSANTFPPVLGSLVKEYERNPQGNWVPILTAVASGTQGYLPLPASGETICVKYADLVGGGSTPMSPCSAGSVVPNVQLLSYPQWKAAIGLGGSGSSVPKPRTTGATSSTSSQADGSAMVNDGSNISVSAEGIGTITEQDASSDPVSAVPSLGPASYFSVSTSPGSVFSLAYVEVCGLSPSAGSIEYYSNGIWQFASNFDLSSGDGCGVLQVDTSSSPSLAQLEGGGVEFASGNAQTPPVGGVFEPHIGPGVRGINSNYHWDRLYGCLRGRLWDFTCDKCCGGVGLGDHGRLTGRTHGWRPCACDCDDSGRYDNRRC